LFLWVILYPFKKAILSSREFIGSLVHSPYEELFNAWNLVRILTSFNARLYVPQLLWHEEDVGAFKTTPPAQGSRYQRFLFHLDTPSQIES